MPGAIECLGKPIGCICCAPQEGVMSARSQLRPLFGNPSIKGPLALARSVPISHYEYSIRPSALAGLAPPGSQVHEGAIADIFLHAWGMLTRWQDSPMRRLPLSIVFLVGRRQYHNLVLMPLWHTTLHGGRSNIRTPSRPFPGWPPLCPPPPVGYFEGVRDLLMRSMSDADLGRHH